MNKKEMIQPRNKYKIVLSNQKFPNISWIKKHLEMILVVHFLETWIWVKNSAIVIPIEKVMSLKRVLYFEIFAFTIINIL
jgi:hypothetical protein